MLVELTPSMRVLLPWLLVPLTLKVRARDGFDGIECASSGGEKPGSVRNTSW
jgi:hypothetical protein